MIANEQGWTRALVQKLTMGMQKMLHVCVNHQQFGACCKAAARYIPMYPGFGGSVFNSKHLRDTTCSVLKTPKLHLKGDLCKRRSPHQPIQAALFSPLSWALLCSIGAVSWFRTSKRWLSTFPGATNALFSGGCARRCGQGDQHVRVVDKAFQLCQQWALSGVI